MRSMDRGTGFVSSAVLPADQEHQRPHRRKQKWIFATLVLAVASIYLLRLDGVFGLWKDDGWYLTLAKSLATGHGYHLINFADEAGVFYYPPGFPVFLSFLYRLYPHFPVNLWLLKS